MVFCWVLAGVAPGSDFPTRSVADTERGVQLLLRVTFITTINMHATHRHAGLQLMPAPKSRSEEDVASQDDTARWKTMYLVRIKPQN